MMHETAISFITESPEIHSDEIRARERLKNLNNGRRKYSGLYYEIEELELDKETL